MQTGMLDPIIRPIIDKKPKAKPAKPIRLQVAYDRPNARLLIEGEGSEYWKENSRAILLKDVEFVVKPGERDGCRDTGSLGFAIGTPSHQVIDNATLAKMKPLLWNGECFIGMGHRVMAAKSILIVGSQMLGSGLITD